MRPATRNPRWIASHPGLAAVLGPLSEQVLALWRGRRRSQTFLVVVSLAMLVLGVSCGIAWLVTGDSWTAAVSWRKPTVFGFSFAVTGLALAAVHRALRPGVLSALTCIGFGVGALVETAVITVQRWRGVPSHFNNATPLDSRLFGAMGTAIIVIALAILITTVRAFRRTSLPAGMALAVRAGLVLLVIGQALGAAIIQHGSAKVAADPATIDTASVVGAAGQLKVPHAVALHGVQVLPVLAWLLSAVAITEARRVQIVATAALGYAGLVAVSALQAFRGTAPVPAGLTDTVIAGLSFALLVVTTAWTARQLWRTAQAAGSAPPGGAGVARSA